MDIGASLILALSSSQAAPPPEEAIRSYLERLEPFGFSGVFLLARDGEIAGSAAVGLADRAAGRRNDLDTPFPLGSVTKHLTAALALRLAERGVLSLEATLPELLDDVPQDKRAITLAMLLAHASGLPGWLGEVEPGSDAAGVTRAILRTELVFPPGTGHEYSNLGFALVPCIVERATGRAWPEVLCEELLERAGMRRTGYAVEAWGDDPAHGYVGRKDVGTLLDSLGGAVPFVLYGSGGLQSTARDMLAWSAALRSGELLSEASLATMTAPRARLGPGLALGLGCGVGEGLLGPWIEHTGSDDVFSAVFRHWLARDQFLFLATNDATVTIEGPLRWITAILEGGEAPAVPVPATLSPEVLRRYAGSWSLGQEGGTVEVVAGEDGLVLRSADPEAAGLLWPVAPQQVARRRTLRDALEGGFRSAARGDWEPLHELLSPFAPLEELLAGLGRHFDAMVAEHGPFQDARAVPGRNRFGEIALVAALSFEHGRVLIEYSFGEREVGSVSVLTAFPARELVPLDPERFVAYDVAADDTWEARFALDDEGRPLSLALVDPRGEPVALRRADGEPPRR